MENENSLILDLYINGQKISCQKPIFDLVENSVGYLKFKLKYSSDWNDLFKLIFFQTATKTLVVKGNADIITIPYEVIQAPGFRVSCVGTDVDIHINDDNTLGQPLVKVRITTDQIPIALKLGGPIKGKIGEMTSDEVNAYELANFAIEIAKNAYTIAWDIQNGLEEISGILGGPGYMEYVDIQYKEGNVIELTDVYGVVHILKYELKNGKVTKTYLDGIPTEVAYDGNKLSKVGNTTVDISGIFN
jgi:hypothetical protein